jgi:twinkle protein
VKRDYVDLGRLYDAGLAMYHAGGMPRGACTGWHCLDGLYTVGAGQWTAVTGFPGSGKSEWLDALLVNLAENDAKWFFALYSPENFPTVGHLVKLVEKRARKPFGEGPNPRMSVLEYQEAATWVLERFVWLNPELKSPEELLDTAMVYGGEGRRLGVVLDPWNTLEHQRGGMNETDYISLVLTHVTHLARATNAHVWLVVHPAKMARDRDGKRPVPTPYDISGSAHWYNKADNVITIHRDQVAGSQDVDVNVQKVRFKNMGHVGVATLKYDKTVGRYFDWGADDTPTDPITGRPQLFADPERRS